MSADAVLWIVMAFCLIVGCPIFVSLGEASTLALILTNIPMRIVALDMLKAYLPVSLAAQHLDTQSVWFALALAAPVLGHAVGVFNGFHGGKCIASAFGAMLALAPRYSIRSTARARSRSAAA